MARKICPVAHVVGSLLERPGRYGSLLVLYSQLRFRRKEIDFGDS
jgi:hypothetical protein